MAAGSGGGKGRDRVARRDGAAHCVAWWRPALMEAVQCAGEREVVVKGIGLVLEEKARVRKTQGRRESPKWKESVVAVKADRSLLWGGCNKEGNAGLEQKRED
ncbi:hypothetical protein H0E87_001858 [Populus deltoides]|uniref:Uncharacterized protein n=1 Tax=Populus deltoides TaxID=3696 RepID=A0A8T2ZTB3_POPDE|nr:hypothetical protein H0E87_001858 [Populus deltoides]